MKIKTSTTVEHEVLNLRIWKPVFKILPVKIEDSWYFLQTLERKLSFGDCEMLPSRIQIKYRLPE